MRIWMNNQTGMSVVEAVIAFGLLGLGAVGAMKMNSMNTRALSQTAAGGKLLAIHKHAHSILQSETACYNTLHDQVPGSGSVGSFKDELGTNFYEVGKEYDFYKIVSIKVEAPSSATATYFAPSSAGMVNVALEVNNIKDTKNPITVRRIKIWALADSGSKILKCFAPSAISSNLWQRSYDEPTDIYYGLNVGIGTSNPGPFLDVVGQLKFLSSDGKAAWLGKGPGNRLHVESDRPVALVREDGTTLVDLSTGDLTMSDVLQPQGHGTPCTAATEGSIRFNRTVGRSQFCDGHWWRSFAN
jgi:hypothetical protein